MALAEGLIAARVCKAGDITITRRSEIALTDLQKRGFKTSTDNAKAVDNADAIFICVLPQQLDEALSQLQASIRPAADSRGLAQRQLSERSTAAFQRA